MADQPILKVPVTVDEEGSVDAFLAKLAQARDALRDLPSQWGGHGPSSAMPSNPFVPNQGTQGGGASGGSGKVPNPGKGAQALPKSSFDEAAKASTNPKLSGQSSFIERFRKSSFESEKSWHLIVRDMEKATKGLSGLSRMSIGLGGLGWLGALGGVGAAAAGVAAGVAGADNSLAAQNLRQRQLHLKPGEEAAFDVDFAKVGGDSSTLAAANAAKLDKNEAVKLGALGINMGQVHDLSTTDLAALMLKQAGLKANEMGDMGGQYWKSFGLDKFVPLENAQAAGSYLNDDPLALDKMHAQQIADVPKFAQSQADQDAATEAKRRLDEALAEDEAALDRAFQKLNPYVVDAATATSNWLDTFSRSGELDADIKSLDLAFKGAVDAMKAGKDALNALFHLSDKPNPGETHDVELYSAPAGSWQANFAQFGQNAWEHLVNGKPLSEWDYSPSKAIDWGLGGGGGGGSSTTPQWSPQFNSLLDSIKQNESSGINGQTNSKVGAAGLYGITPENARAYGIDPMDPVGSRYAAGQIYGKFYSHFHDFAKAAAAYDGDTHIDEDSKKYGGDWLKGAKQETINYLKKLELQGQGLDLTPAQQAEIDRMQTVKKEIDNPGTAPNAGGNGYNFSLPKAPMNPQMAPIQIGVNVSAPAGSNTSVSIGGLAAS